MFLDNFNNSVSVRDDFFKNPDFDKAIIENRYLVYQFDHMGQTLLHWAVKKNDL